MLERSGYVSFANCGLPYHVGGVIERRSALLLQTPESLRARFNLDVRVGHEVVAIDRTRKVVRVRELAAEVETELSYDALVLSAGAISVGVAGYLVNHETVGDQRFPEIKAHRPA